MEEKKSKTPNRDLLVEMGYDGAVVFENPDYDGAIIGVSSDGQVIYDYQTMAEILMTEDGMTYEDAIDFIDYNTIRALPYIPNHPIILYRMDDIEISESL